MLDFIKMNRFTFFIIHFLISCCVALVASYFVFFIWYPYPLYRALGVVDIAVIVFAIDVILGPILGFIIYDKTKASLKFDIFVIILIQFSAFIYGLYTLNQARPLYLVFAGYNFETVRKNELIDGGDTVDFFSAIFQKPEFVSLNSNYYESRKNLLISKTNLRDTSFYTPFYLKNGTEHSVLVGIPLLNRFNSEKSVQSVVQKYPNADSWVPLRANNLDMVVLFSKEERKLIAAVDLRPW
ncbi:TfpX/TfpZ family type IV pilin accessory protein [Acinetobacter sp. YH12145]|uniref:TfpX/TfpZ family type IV pilin accessory protein n=1 Tax=Acinetobacter sp. YH12145 TaxID=2601129 RepID=UPI0015D2EBFC|nr:TfpX/TfpZ family type IV pilin accessory protein [Acinetobacter sp. YH12145]